jgi:phage gpG-like protein
MARARGSGGVKIAFQPPLEFILRQNTAFQRQLLILDDLWDRFKPLMSEFETEWFASEGEGSWPPLADSTLRQKTGSEMLVETGTLKRSLTDAGQAARTTARTMEWATDVAYAGFHQTGGYVPGRPPQRQVIPDPFPVEWRREFERETVNYVNAAAARTWGRV